MQPDTLDPTGLAERLTTARKAARVTQEAAATHLGMSRPTFIAIEKAQRRPQREELVQLAALYQVPLNRLLRPMPVSEAGQPPLRATLEACLGDGPEPAAAINTLCAYVEDYQYLENLLAAKATVHFPPPIRIAPGPIERFAEHCAQEERARLNLGAHQPLYSLRKTLEPAGVHVFFAALEADLAGLYAFVPGFAYCILVNQQQPREKRRAVIAQAYGHFLFDRNRPGADYARALQRKPEHQRFAAAFAAAFLMPESGVQCRFYQAVEHSGDFNVADLCQMADYFAVSLMAMASRLESIGLIPRGSWAQISAVNGLSPLPAPAAGLALRTDDAPEPYPQRYKLLAVQAFLDEKISEGQLARLLRCQRIRARELVQECSLVQHDEKGPTAPLALGRSLLTPMAA